MSHNLRIYYTVLGALAVTWISFRAGDIVGFVRGKDFLSLLGIIGLYLGSHLFRMIRLALLTLDERSKIFPVIAAHSLTAFPSSFLPLKIGEILRLVAFFYVYDYRRKALAIWVAERFGDIFVVTALICGLYMFEVSLPRAMRTIFVSFVFASMFGLLGLFAVAKVFVFLNRYLVLTSYTTRGLLLLRASHALRRLEIDIYKSVEGRMAGFLLLSVLIWALEIAALSMFIDLFSTGLSDFAAMFAAGLLASLPGASVSDSSAFGLYQSLALVILAGVFLVVCRMQSRHRS